MIPNLIGLIINLVVIAAGVWLILRVRRKQNKLLKWGGTGLLGFVTLIATAFFVLAALGFDLPPRLGPKITRVRPAFS